MCRKHLLGEHVEMHMFVGSINKGINLNGYLSKGLVDVSLIEERHDELVVEMTKRGYIHKSNLPTYHWYLSNKGFIDVAANEAELKRRCKDCRFG